MKKLLSKYKLLPKQIKASIWFVVSNVMVKGISFITLPIFAHLISTEEYGTIYVYQSWVSVISIITTLTIWGGVFNVGMVKYSDRKAELISAFQGLAIFITFLFASASMLLLPIIEPLFKMSKFLIVCMYLEILSMIPFYLWSTEQRYIFEYRKLIFVTMLMSILNPTLGVIAVLNTNYKAEARIVSNLTIQFVVGLVMFVLNQKRGKSFYVKDFWKFGFAFNVVLIPHYLSMQILNQSDRLMIDSICGKSDAGIYGVAYNFGVLLTLVTNGINSSLTPHVYQCLKEKNEGKLKRQTTVVIFFVAIMTMGIIAIIPDVFHLCLPETYYPAMKVIPPVTAGMFFLFLYPLFGAIEFYYEENKYVTAASIIGAVFNILLNYIFIRKYGFIAAAYTTLFCYICFSVCHYIFMKKIMKKRNNNIDIYDLRAIIAISLFVIIGSILLVIVYDRLWIRWGIIATIIAVSYFKRATIIELFKSLRK